MFYRLEKLIFLALIFSIPFQKRTFLFGPSPEGEGFFEWTSGFLYFTDILIIFLFVLWIVRVLLKSNFNKVVEIRFQQNKFLSSPLLLSLFLLFAFVSLTQAELIDVGLYRFIKLGEFIFLFFYVVARARDTGIKRILQVFVASGVFQSIIAILQFAKQSSLGLHIFHESTLELGMRGVAQIAGAGGAEMIRVYGTFTNPNVLAGFLGICLFFAFYLFITQKNCINVRSYNNTIIVVGVFILLFALLLTFSRGVIIFFTLTVILFFVMTFLLKQFQAYRKILLRLFLVFFIFYFLFIIFLWPELSSRFLESSVSEPAISERLFFNKVGVDTVSKNYMPMFFGIGIGNFVNHYIDFLPNLEPHLYQPVHNIFILIASEIGIIGLIAFILFLALLLGRAVRKFLKSSGLNLTKINEDGFLTYFLLLTTFYMLLIGMYDHYFWTLQQGSLMFWILLGLLASLFGIDQEIRK